MPQCSRMLAVVNEGQEVGNRVREARKRQGLTQEQLARLSGVSISLIAKLERGEYGGLRLETVRKLAVVLRVTTSALADGDAPLPGRQSAALCEPVRRALDGEPGGDPPDAPTLEAVRSAFAQVAPLLLASRFTELGAALPPVLRDADALVAGSANGARAAARSLRAQVRQVTGSLMLHAWQFDVAERAFDMAMGDADDPLTAMSVVDERCWGLIRQGRFAETRDLAFRWADQAEPRMSTASREQLAGWGRLLIRAAAASVRDNRPDEASDALRLAGVAGSGTGGDFVLPYSPWHVFGPVTASVAAAENAAKSGQPDVTLSIASKLEGSKLRLVHRFAPSHRLDVAHAHAAQHQYAQAITVLQELRRARPQWLPRQRYARDILSKIITRRRTLTDEMRDLAGFLSLPL